MYADDTTLYCIRKIIDNMSAALNQPLIELYACCVSNKLISHPKKLECMLSYRGLFTAPSHPCARNNLEWVTHIQLLGVDIDDKQAGPFKLRD